MAGNSIWLYVRDTHESRYMTIHADLYRGPGLGTKVATLTRGQLNDFAHNEWRAPANTFLEPDTDYWFVLDCISGCANDNWAQLGATYSAAEDGGPDSGYGGVVPTIVASFGLLPVHDHYPGLADDRRHRVDGSFHVSGVAITFTPKQDYGYGAGEAIDVTLTFTADAYATRESVVSIRVGDDGRAFAAPST